MHFILFMPHPYPYRGIGDDDDFDKNVQKELKLIQNDMLKYCCIFIYIPSIIVIGIFFIIKAYNIDF